MDAEYESLMKNLTWELVPRPKSTKNKRVNILTSVWVLVVKRDEKGVIQRFKARLAVRGFLQKFGIDCLTTYSPVVRIESVRLVMILALMQGLDCRHVDFVTAFLNGELADVDIYMEQPQGYDDGSDRVCHLLKGLYGLKQASKIWNDTLHAYLVELQFVQCVFDAGVYYRNGTHSLIYLTVYVDDIVIAAKPADIEIVVRELSARFEVKDLGRVKHLLGMEVNFQPGVILCLSQTAYVERLATRFQLEHARTVRSPQMHNERMPPIETDKTQVNNASLPYREIVGSLQYLVACTRPDMASVVRCLGKYNGAYTRENFAMAKRAVRYLLGTKTFGLVYRPTDAMPLLIAFADADHAMCADTSRSNTGFVLQLNGCAWMWKSKQQSRVTTNTCASELVTACDCVDNLVWARQLLAELLVKTEVSTVHCDNQSALHVIANRGNSKKVQRFAKEARMIAEFVDEGAVQMKYVSTTENVADIITKALGPQRFEYLRDKLNLEDVVSAWNGAQRID
ncbi:hypothetical protein PF004_g9734 [Phytophthora fragariae]|uniref:Reverse transcriptase Ty1/copia-type domain-containing protein n=1 Tax=Phytophthora fragariae TaxID=53985 RepID=A0A6G0P2Z8_9STRA|nr:hypothetical protein PF004_g9734 [Phytophthora fragariae]